MAVWPGGRPADFAFRWSDFYQRVRGRRPQRPRVPVLTGASAHQSPSVTADRIAAAERRSGKGKAVTSQIRTGLAGGDSPEKGWERRSNTFSRDWGINRNLFKRGFSLFKHKHLHYSKNNILCSGAKSHLKNLPRGASFPASFFFFVFFAALKLLWT